MVQCLEDLLSRGATQANIRVVCIVAATPALKLLAEKYKRAPPQPSRDFEKRFATRYVCTQAAR